MPTGLLVRPGMVLVAGPCSRHPRKRRGGRPASLRRFTAVGIPASLLRFAALHGYDAVRALHRGCRLSCATTTGMGRCGGRSTGRGR